MSISAALRAALAGLLAAALTGCVMVVSPFGLFERGHELREITVSGEGAAKILLLEVDGFISDEPQSRALGLMREESMVTRLAAELDKAREDETIRAVVVRIDSPGGGVAASDALYELLLRYRADTGLPMIAALGGMATSGGYYVACAADTIVASPTTVTGSIGVILVGMNLAGLLDKLGVEDETYTSGEHKDLLSPLRGATPEEREIVQGIIDRLYTRFTNVVRDSRTGIDAKALDEATDGRIFHAQRARELGLVDRVAHLQDAIDAARERAGVDRARVVRYVRPGEHAETIHAGGAGMRPRAGLLERLAGPAADPGFYYLWRPGLPATP